MNIVAMAEIITTIYVMVALVSQLTNKEKERSAKALELCTIITFFWLLAEIVAYLFSSPDNPLVIIWLANFLSYILGTVVLLVFIHYCYLYIRERTCIEIWILAIPSFLELINGIIISIYFISGKIISFEAGRITRIGDIPVIIQVFNILTLIYLPCVAFSKRKEIGFKAVYMLGIYGIAPILAIIILLITGYDFTVALGAFSVVVVTILLQSDDKKKQLREVNQKLQASNVKLQQRLDMINTMTSFYFVTCYIDLEKDRYITLTTRDNIHKHVDTVVSAQEMLNVANKELISPEFQKKMRKFFDLSTVNERMGSSSIISHKYIGATTGWSRAYIIAGDRNSSGKLRHVIFATRSIQDEQEREEQHIKQMEDLTRVVTSAGLGMWKIIIKDGVAPKMEANDKMRELLGIENQDLTDEQIYDYWYKRIIPREISTVNTNMGVIDNEGFVETTYLWNHPTLGEIYVRGGGYSERLEDGTTIRSGYHADVTNIVRDEERQKEELANAKKEAEVANAAKSTFLFNMSHDIRTPLNAILGYTDLIINSDGDKERTLDYASKIKGAGDFLLSLINNVLEMARIESGKIVINEEPYVSGTIADELGALFSESMKAKNIDFQYSLTSSTKYIFADKVKIKEIYLNLLSNAYKYTPNGGKVRMTFRELPSSKPGYVRIQGIVSDTGIGMSEDYLPKLYDEFIRSSNSTESGIQGTGLGMPIVKKYIDLMGGSIEVQSEIGKGTTFTVTLTHKIAHVDDMESATAKNVDTSIFEGKRILLAEDNELNAEIAIEILTGAGFEVEHAKNGVECVDMLTKADAHYYDLILMDIQMPKLDGYGATERIRNIDNIEKAQIPIIAMTANAFDEDKQNAFSIGMNGHIAKPINIPVLFDTLSSVVKA